MERMAESRGVTWCARGWRRTRVVAVVLGLGTSHVQCRGRTSWAGPWDSVDQTASLPVGPRASVLLSPEVVLCLKPDRELLGWTGGCQTRPPICTRRVRGRFTFFFNLFCYIKELN